MFLSSAEHHSGRRTPEPTVGRTQVSAIERLLCKQEYQRCRTVDNYSRHPVGPTELDAPQEQLLQLLLSELTICLARPPSGAETPHTTNGLSRLRVLRQRMTDVPLT